MCTSPLAEVQVGAEKTAVVEVKGVVVVVVVVAPPPA
jgi:hypothetical protein